MIYMISYDLHSPTNNRLFVEEDIKSLGLYCKYLSTTFLVSCDSDIEYVQTVCTQHIDTNDDMIIAKVEKPIMGYLADDQWNWIRANL